MKLLFAVAAIATSAHAVTSDQFEQPGKLRLCYTQQDSTGAVSSLIVLNYDRPSRDAFGNMTRAFAGYEQRKPSEQVSAIYGSATYYPAENTQPGVPDIRISGST